MADEIVFLYKLLKVASLMAVQFDTHDNCYKIKNNIFYYIYHILIGASMAISVLLLEVYQQTILNFVDYADTGNYFNYVTVQFSYLAQIAFNLWWILKQHQHLQLLEIVRKLRQKFLQGNSRNVLLYTPIRMAALILCVIIYVLNMAYMISIKSGHGVVYFVWITYTINCISSVFILSIYISIVMTISHSLNFVSYSIENIMLPANRATFSDTDLCKLQELFQMHDEIIYLSMKDVSSMYGIPILICTIFISLESISCVYLLAISNSSHMVVVSILWMVPMLSFLLIAFICSNMAEEDVIERLFNLIHILGVIPAEYCKKQNKLISSKDHDKYMFRCTIIILIVCEMFIVLVCILSFYDVFDVYHHISKTANYLAILQLLECCITQLLLTTMFYVCRHRNVEIFNSILKSAVKINNEISCKIIRKRIYAQSQLNILLLVIFLANIGLLSVFSGSQTWIMYILRTVILGIYFVYNSVYLSCFTCVIFVLMESMKVLNNKIQCTQSVNEIKDILNMRNEMLTSCRSDINQIYGIVIILQSGFSLTSISTFLFITTVMINWSTTEIKVILLLILQSSLTLLPPLIIYVNALWANNTDKEANKTAKILAKVSRTNVCVDQMIDKFLLKNLRQKPILTAYGFFSLDKSTLFKLFTAIFTYMVILVQFKEMESSTNQLNTRTQT